MTEFKQIYKCDICSNIVEVLHTGDGTLVCCNQDMTLQKEKTKAEEGNEKHVPVIEENDQGVIVKVGDTPHPMEDEHFIEWIEIITDKGYSKKFLKPGEKPEVVFPVKSKVKARAYCNVHGLWISE